MNVGKTLFAQIMDFYAVHELFANCRTPLLQRMDTSDELRRAVAAYSFQRPRVAQDAGVSDQQHDAAGVHHCRSLQESLAGRSVFQVDQAAFAHQEIPWHERERGEDANLVRRVHLCPHRNRQEGASTRCLTLHFVTDSLGQRFRENPFKQGNSRYRRHYRSGCLL